VSILFAKNIAIVRTFIPYVAGMVNMPKVPYFIYNILGSLIWVPVFVLLGYFLGGIYPNFVQRAVPWVGGFILLFVFLVFIKYIRFRLRK